MKISNGVFLDLRFKQDSMMPPMGLPPMGPPPMGQQRPPPIFESDHTFYRPSEFSKYEYEIFNRLPLKNYFA